MNNYSIEEKLPSLKEYLLLREAAGWSVSDNEVMERGLDNSVYCVCAVANSTVIGMSRLIGDHGLVYFVADTIVLPEYQNQGIGTQLMEGIMSYLEKNAPANSFITLMSAKGREGFYEKFGFFKRPNDDYGHGMMVEL
ncbi:GNAT family N-acetyltransferase [Methanolobus sp. ZRKC3]|uniref:GNAT family N-acetyltransferase n=1 Tax=Methanolobus sp. ZRKC3 TaxID=3125786 RepID=UPI003253409D